VKDVMKEVWGPPANGPKIKLEKLEKKHKHEVMIINDSQAPETGLGDGTASS
jgi:hypothetical protein